MEKSAMKTFALLPQETLEDDQAKVQYSHIMRQSFLRRAWRWEKQSCSICNGAYLGEPAVAGESTSPMPKTYAFYRWIIAVVPPLRGRRFPPDPVFPCPALVILRHKCFIRSALKLKCCASTVMCVLFKAMSSAYEINKTPPGLSFSPWMPSQ